MKIKPLVATTTLFLLTCQLPAVDYIEPQSASGSSLAVVVGPASLAHTTQLAGTGIEAVFQQLDAALKEAGSALDRTVKLNVYAANADVVPQVQAALAKRFSGPAKPAVSFVVSALPDASALVAMDAIAITNKNTKRSPTIAVLPAGGAVYVSGQAEKGADLGESTRKTMESLKTTLTFLGRDLSHVVSIKSFLQPMSNVAAAQKAITDFFDGAPPPMVFVEWTMASPIEIELVAAAPLDAKAAETVDYLTPPGMKPSPVYSKVARVNRGKTIYFSGFCGQKPDAEGQIRDIFADLGRLLKKSGSDFKHLAKATYYVSDDAASKKLNEIRPEIYDPQRPPAASKAPVKGVGFAGKGITIDMIGVTAE